MTDTVENIVNNELIRLTYIVDYQYITDTKNSE